MKKKVVISIYAFTIFISLLSLGFNIYFLATKPLEPSGVFDFVGASVLELKAESEDVGTSYGSAVIVSDDGTIVTNAHVITYKRMGEINVFDEIQVRFIDEEEYRDIAVVKYDTNIDIAVLKIDCDRELTPVRIADKNNLDFGNKVYAVGNMSNYGISITSGSVSIPSINVSYNEVVRNVIQCDLTISDGNSGGALVDKDGKLIGLTTFRLKDNSNNIIYGISYSIPASTIMEYIQN